MNKDGINIKLLNYIEQEFAKDPLVKIDAQTDLFATGLIDSLGVMKLIRFIEATFDYQMPLLDILPENFSSVENISEYLSKPPLSK